MGSESEGNKEEDSRVTQVGLPESLSYTPAESPYSQATAPRRLAGKSQYSLRNGGCAGQTDSLVLPSYTPIDDSADEPVGK